MELLNKEELNELERCEVVIRQGLQTFIEVGQALLTIRDKRLYRSEFKTFEEYCNERWSMGRNYINRLISATEVISNLVPRGTILPKNEYEARPLTKLEPEVQVEVWSEVVAQHGQDITAPKVQAIADQFSEVNDQIKQAKKEPLFTADSPEELLRKAKEVARERAEKKRQAINAKGETDNIPKEDQDLIDQIKSGKTVVININRNFHAMKYAKDNGLFVQIDRFSEWGNPYHIGQDGDRDDVCNAFQVYFMLKRTLLSNVGQLKGKTLGCHCYPERCHGDHLKFLADGNE